MLSMTSAKTGKRKGKWVLDPSKRHILIEILSALFCILFSILEFVAGLMSKCVRSPTNKRKIIHSIGDRTKIARCNSLHRTNSEDILRDWISQYRAQNRTNIAPVYEYSSVASLFATVTLYTAWVSYGKRTAKLVLRDHNPIETASRVVESVKRIRARAKKSVKFRFQFKDLLRFLGDIERCRASTVTEFLNEIAKEMLEMSSSGFLRVYHTQFRCKLAARNVHETASAASALFVKEGANLNSFFSDGLWIDSHRIHHAAMMVMMNFAMGTCSMSSTKEINVTEYSGVERSLFSRNDGAFRRFHSLFWYGDTYLQKDMLLVDVTLNDCNELVELSWPWEVLDRAVWALEYGRKHVRRELYLELEGFDERRDLDLQGYDARQLLIFSLAGIVRFDGGGDSLFDITGSDCAKIVIRGKLPLPCVQDLVILGVVKKNRCGSYWVNTLPGTRETFTLVECNGNLQIVRYSYAKTFRADPCQLVL